MKDKLARRMAGRRFPRALLASAVPFVIVSSGSMDNNGALSGITAVPSAYPAAYVYLPANAISAGSAAGWYFASFSSTTAATVYNNVYTTGVPEIPASPTAFATTGPGAYTQSAAGGILGPNISVPANTLGINGALEAIFATSCTNSANTKQAIFRLASTSVGTQTLTSVAFANSHAMIANRGIATRQTSWLLSSGGTNYSVTPTARAIDTTAAQVAGFMLLMNTATETMTLESYALRVCP